MKSKDVRRQVQSLRDELFDLAQELVRCPSVTGTEDDAQRILADRLEDWGLEVDCWRPDRERLVAHPAYCDDGLPVDRLNLVARFGEVEKDAPQAQRAAALVLNGHIDVVPEGDRDRWEREPFDGRIERGALHGRGACDMKGGLAACCIAVRAVQKLGVSPRRPILLQSVIGEETGGLGTLAAIERGYRADAAVIAEPTQLNLCPVQAGALSFRLHLRGRAAHGAMRERGVSAVSKLWPVWQRLERLEEERHRDFRHPLFQDNRLAAPLSVGKLSAGNWPSTVPEELTAEGRYGIFPGEEVRTAREAFEQAVAEAGEDDEWLAQHPVRVEWFEGQFESGETPLDAEILEELNRCHFEVTGREPRSHGVSYGSDLRLFTRHANMPAVLYGPGDVELAHAANEWVPLEELSAAAEVLALLICGKLGETLVG